MKTSFNRRHIPHLRLNKVKTSAYNFIIYSFSLRVGYMCTVKFKSNRFKELVKCDGYMFVYKLLKHVAVK